MRLGVYAPGRYELRLETSAGMYEHAFDVPAADRVIWKVSVAELVK